MILMLSGGVVEAALYEELHARTIDCMKEVRGSSRFHSPLPRHRLSYGVDVDEAISASLNSYPEQHDCSGSVHVAAFLSGAGDAHGADSLCGIGLCDGVMVC